MEGGQRFGVLVDTFTKHGLSMKNCDSPQQESRESMFSCLAMPVSSIAIYHSLLIILSCSFLRGLRPLILYDLPTPTNECQRQSPEDSARVTNYLLGKNLPFSGIRVLSSSSALMLQTTAVIPNMMTVKTAVLDFQFLGCAYHPPAGDQTCLGYLVECQWT